MCGSTKAPPVVKDDPVADQAKADAQATATSNAEIALRRRQRLQNSLLTMGASGNAPRVDTPQTLLAQAAQPGVQTGKQSKPNLHPPMGDVVLAAFGNFGPLRRDTLGGS